MNLHMIRAVRLINAQQKGLPNSDFLSALADANTLDAFSEWLRRRGSRAWLSGADPLLIADMLATESLAALVAQQAIKVKALRDMVFASNALSLLVANSADAMAFIVNNADAMVDALSGAVAFDAIFSVPSAKSTLLSGAALGLASVPAMAGATAPSGIAAASSIYAAGYEGWRAFDKSLGTYWASSPSSGANSFLQYSFPGEAFISKIAATPYAGAFSPVNCRIECSHDGVIFDVAKSFVMTPGVLNQVDITKSGFYKHWRLFIETTNGAAYTALYELNFAGFVKP